MLFGDSISTTCNKCKRYQKSQKPFIEVTGKGKEEILIVGPAANSESLGNLSDLDDFLWSKGIEFEEDCWYIPCVQCSKNIKTTTSHVSNCAIRVEDTIKELNPKFILCFGTDAIKSVCQPFQSLGTASEYSLNGTTAPLHDYDAWCFFSMDFTRVFKNKKNQNISSEFERDIDKFKALVKEDPELPDFNPYKDTFLLYEYEDIIEKLEEIYEDAEVIAFDYETTSLKPHKKNSKITVASVCADGVTYSFPVRYQKKFSKEQQEEIEDLIADILECEDIYSIAHNALFEWSWSHFKLGAIPKINYCTQIAQHLLDPRSKITGLKHQSFVRFGVCGYEDYSKKFIKSEGESSYGLNKMDEMPLTDQLTYCAADSRITYFMWKQQVEETPESMQFLMYEYMRGMDWFAKMSANGFPIDGEYYKEQEDLLHNRMKEIIEILNESQEAISFVNEFGREMNWQSNKDLKAFYFDHLKLKAVKQTASGNPSVDEEALTKMGHWTTELLLEYRKKAKLADTYIAQFTRENVDNKVHPSFSLSNAASGRPSCNNPNLLNIPKRNQEQKEIIRRGMKPSKGHQLGEIDFSGIEVSTSACYHLDKNFIHYLQNEDADMHRDNGADIWKIPSDEVTKMIRFYAKNGWTFPQFYGDWYKSCGETLWEECLDLKTASGVPLREHIKEQGIGTKQKFLKHLQEVERKMWEERFPEYNQWKKDINQEYIDNGEIYSYVGFRCKGQLDRKQTTNLPIQGTAYFVLMWCAASKSNIQEWLEKHEFESKIICQVYDSLIFDFHPEEKEEILIKVKEICEKKAIEFFKWITVPYKIDIELGEIDGDFNDMTEYEIKNNKLVKSK